jgi:hypothetical protein
MGREKKEQEISERELLPSQRGSNGREEEESWMRFLNALVRGIQAGGACTAGQGGIKK